MADSGCSICLETGDNAPDRGVVITGCCKNLFHLDCIVQLYITNKSYTCPLCRGRMDVVTTPASQDAIISSDAEEEEPYPVFRDVRYYVVDDEETATNSDEEVVNSSSNSNERVVSSSSNSDEEDSVPGSLSINNDQVYIYCRTDSGKLYVKDKLSAELITELEIRHELQNVKQIKCLTLVDYDSFSSTHHIVIADKTNINIFVVNDGMLDTEFKIKADSPILAMYMRSHINTVSVNVSLESTNEESKHGRFEYHELSYHVIDCSPCLIREY